jgi:hypothetical protein
MTMMRMEKKEHILKVSLKRILMKFKRISKLIQNTNRKVKVKQNPKVNRK